MLLVNAYLWLNKTLRWADEMIQQVLDPQNNDLCSTPNSHMVNRKNQLHKLFFDFSSYTMAYIPHICANANKYNKN